MAEKELAGKVAIVTGATRRRGLGRAIALCLADAGAHVVVTGSGTKAGHELPADERDSGWKGAESIADEARGLGVRTLALAADVSSSAAVQRLMAETVRAFGRIDILINNATYARGEDRVALGDLDDDLWRRIVDVNLTGTMLCCKYAARALDQRRGVADERWRSEARRALTGKDRGTRAAAERTPVACLGFDPAGSSAATAVSSARLVS